MHARTILVPCLAALALAACAQKQAAPLGARNPTYSADLTGKAPNCTAPEVQITQGQDATGTIATGGGGWCGIAVTLGGNALTAALLAQAPRSGHVYVHTVGDVTRVDYTPAAGAVGADSFAVKFIPGGETMRVTVSGATAAAVGK